MGHQCLLHTTSLKWQGTAWRAHTVVAPPCRVCAQWPVKRSQADILNKDDGQTNKTHCEKHIHGAANPSLHCTVRVNTAHQCANVNKDEIYASDCA